MSQKENEHTRDTAVRCVQGRAVLTNGGSTVQVSAYQHPTMLHNADFNSRTGTPPGGINDQMLTETGGTDGVCESEDVQ